MDFSVELSNISNQIVNLEILTSDNEIKQKFLSIVWMFSEISKLYKQNMSNSNELSSPHFDKNSLPTIENIEKRI